MSSKIPDGFMPFADVCGYTSNNGPYYVKDVEGGGYQFGFLTDERHRNPNNVIHGTALIGFIDTAFGHVIVHGTGRYCATVSLTTEFISSAEPGVWVDAVVRTKKITRSMAFLSADICHDGNLLMSATTVFKLFGEYPDKLDKHGLPNSFKPSK